MAYTKDAPSAPIRKVCTACRKEKPLNEFYSQKEGKFGRSASCMQCRRDAQAARRSGGGGAIDCKSSFEIYRAATTCSMTPEGDERFAELAELSIALPGEYKRLLRDSLLTRPRVYGRVAHVLMRHGREKIDAKA